jgi:hypothetical protein
MSVYFIFHEEPSSHCFTAVYGYVLLELLLLQASVPHELPQRTFPSTTNGQSEQVLALCRRHPVTYADCPAVYYSALISSEVFGKTNTSQIIDLLGNDANIYTP